MKRNKFNLSHYKLGSCDMGKLYPISCYEVLPGDSVRQGTNVFLRFAPMLSPVMHPVKVKTYTFYVPYRLLWDNFEDFITGGPDGLDTHTVPMADASQSSVAQGTIEDYLGIPPGYSGLFNELPIRAYYRIWNDYFRDQDLQSENPLGTKTSDSGYTLSSGGTFPLNISWEKDYFTTARPWPQKGAEVNVPVNSPSSTTLSVVGDGTGVPVFNLVDKSNVAQSTFQNGYVRLGSVPTPLTNAVLKTTRGETDEGGTTTDYNYNLSWANPRLKVQSSSDGSIGNVRLDDLREAFALQRFEEARAMYGSRYTEYLRYLGVRSSDARLQRPEYLGGSSNVVQFSEVLQTAVDGSNPVGTLRGHGIGASRGRRFRRFFEEHGLVMTFLVIRPIAIYQQSLNKMWSREVKEDFWQRELQHIGQQEVLNKEIYCLGANPDSVFGYQNRYDDYRSVPSSVCGEMRSTLNYWHLARDFANQPVLNESFITGAPTKRVFAEQTMNEIYFMAQMSVVARRLMSKTGNPIL